MAKLFSWLKFGRKRDSITPEPGAGSPPTPATMTPPVEHAEPSMPDAGRKADAKATTKSTGTKKSTPKKTTSAPPAKGAKKSTPSKK